MGDAISSVKAGRGVVGDSRSSATSAHLGLIPDCLLSSVFRLLGFLLSRLDELLEEGLLVSGSLITSMSDMSSIFDELPAGLGGGSEVVGESNELEEFARSLTATGKLGLVSVPVTIR